MSRRPAGAAALLLALALLHGCAGGNSFPQRPGFLDWFAANPPDPEPAAADARALLQRHRPVLHLPPGAPGPIDFYRDYIAHGALAAGGREYTAVDRARLAAHADDPAAVFRHEPPAVAPRPVAYGRVDRAELQPFGELTFLTWHFVFRHSGLPAELPAWQEALAGLLGNRDDWHQLDHYTAATLVLAPGERPLGLLLQQHNHLRGYWFGRDLELPADGRPRLAAAVRSNELYPRPPAPTRHRVVRFPTAGNIDWLVRGDGDRPWTGGHDLVRPGRPVDYALEFLPQTDPFYRFQGYLGELRLLPGRDGPPGADYKTVPGLMDRRLQFCGLRWPGGASADTLAPLRRLFADPDDAAARERLFDRCRDFIHARLDGPSETTAATDG